MLINIDEEKVFEHFSEDKIEEYMEENEISYLESMLYLWLFNNISISTDDQRKNCGREMYKKFAKGVTRFLEGRY